MAAFRTITARIEATARSWQGWTHHRLPLVCLALMLLAMAMRMAHIATESVYLDEAFSIWYGQQRLGFLLEGVARDTNPPLHFVLLKYWMGVFGKDETAVRFLSTLLSVCTLPVIMAIGKRFFDSGTAIAAAVIFAASDIHVYYSHEARAYTLVVFLAACSLWFFLALMECGRWRDAVGLALVNALLLHSHYAIYGFLLVQGLLAFVLSLAHGKWPLRYLLSQLAALLLFLPWLLFFLSRFQMPSQVPELADGDMLHFVLLRFAGSPAMLWAFAALLALGLPVAWMVRRRQKAKEEARKVTWQQKLLVLVGLGLLAMFLNFGMSAYGLPTFKDNYVLFATVGIYLLLGWAWAQLPFPATLRWALGIFAVWYMVTMVKYHYFRQSDWRAAAAQIGFLDGEETLKLVGLNYLDLPLMYYYDFEAFKDYRRTQQKMNARHMFQLFTPGDFRAAMPEQYPRVLLIDGDFRLYEEGYPWIGPLEEIFGPAREVYKFRSIEVWRFERAPSP